MIIEGASADPRLEWHFAVEDAATGNYLGSCCLMVERSSPSSAELGYWFLREAWGQGYATESSAAMLELGFHRLGFHRVWGKCHTHNTGPLYPGGVIPNIWLQVLQWFSLTSRHKSEK